MVKVDVQVALTGRNIPSPEEFQVWASAVDSRTCDVEQVAIRIVDESEMKELNEEYRKQAQATNVLAFPAEIPAETKIPFIGDIVICAPVVAKEAAQQGKSEISHWAHMVLHGILHLQGYDHIDEADAKIMEKQEIQLMNKLGFSNPYV